MSDKLYVCDESDISGLYLPENRDLSEPDAFFCRVHHTTYSTRQEADTHVAYVREGRERRVERRVI